MFLKGDKVIYGQTGVCIVEDIVEKAIIKNNKQLYYVLKPVFQTNNTIFAPVSNLKVAIRPILTKEEANTLIDKIPEYAQKGKVITDEALKNICLSNCEDLVLATSVMFEKKKTALSNKKKLGFQDEKLMQVAENLLFGELSVALNISPSEVKAYIDNRLKK